MHRSDRRTRGTRNGPGRRITGWTAAALAAATAFAVGLSPAPQAAAYTDPGAARTVAVEHYLDAVRTDPARLHAFLDALPKGGDLHNHLSGAVPTADLIALAAQEGLCIDRTTSVASPEPCTEAQRPAADAEKDQAFREQVVRAWSMQGFDGQGGESGHDHFFATFGKFGAVTHQHYGRLLAAVANEAARQHEYVLETMLSWRGPQIAEHARKVGWNPDPAAERSALMAGGAIDRLVAAARSDTDAALAEYRDTLHCGTAQAQPGCRVELRLTFQVGRNDPPEAVFAEMLVGFLLASQDQRFAAVNLVQAEDGPVALRDYGLQMRMVRHLRAWYPRAHVTLHAGELTPALVPRKDLRFHMRDAVLVAGAERVGHGVDAAWEDDPAGLRRLLRERHVPVEINLTSNCQILQVCGVGHPLGDYLRAGVPVVLSTDDPGVEGTDLDTEYYRATWEQQLSYRQLRTLARAALDHAFLPGVSLWRGRDDYRPSAACAHDLLGSAHPSGSCRVLLRGSRRASLEWQQEADLLAFEQHHVVAL